MDKHLEDLKDMSSKPLKDWDYFKTDEEEETETYEELREQDEHFRSLENEFYQHNTLYGQH